jgi:hypothetical protein
MFYFVKGDENKKREGRHTGTAPTRRTADRISGEGQLVQAGLSIFTLGICYRQTRHYRVVHGVWLMLESEILDIFVVNS